MIIGYGLSYWGREVKLLGWRAILYSNSLCVLQVVAAVREVMRRCAGGYACVSMIIGYGLLGFRDPNGIRPLCYGRRKIEAGNGGYEYMVASGAQHNWYYPQLLN
jgi:glutamine phosphoribosylpyrophosphate amidotransferase